MKEKFIDYTKNYKRTIFTWSLYDFANQPFPTIIITFIYSIFFTGYIAQEYNNPDSIWLYAVSLSSIIIALLSPIMGTIADSSGYRKTFLVLLTWLCIIACAMLYFPVQGQIFFALALIIISNVGFELGSVFCNSYLPNIAPRGKIGRISGYGWSFGYAGGLISLILCLFLFGENVYSMILFVSCWFAMFSIPTFIFLKDKKRDKWNTVSIKRSYYSLLSTFKEIKKYRNILRFLIARMFYNDAILTIFFFGGIYAQNNFSFNTEQMLIFGIVLNVAAGLGAFVFGFLDDVLGAKRTIQISNYAIFISIMIAVLASSVIWFWIAGIILGAFSGPNQSASRSLMGRIVPKDKVSEFFGFYAFSGKATSFIGPLLLAIIKQITGSQKIGMLAVALILIAGIYLLSGVNDKYVEKDK